MSERRVRVAVIFGGRSGEHEVSCASATSVLEHLDREVYEVVPIKIGTDGSWRVGADRALGGGDADGPRRAGWDSLGEVVAVLRTVDVAFPVLHGPYGEDGTVQALLELAGVPYVGNGVASSAIGLDKDVTKRLLAAEGIAVADSVVLRVPPGREAPSPETAAESVTAADRDRLGLPVFVKPARAGSSIGVTRVDDWDDLPKAIAVARESDEKVLVEAAVPGREIDLAVLEYPDGRVEAGPPLEIHITDGHGFFDYEAKYRDGDTVFDIPARLEPAAADALRDAAVLVFRSLGCRGLLRVDFFLRETATGVEPVVNEVNTLPGFTAASQYPQMWRAAGLDYPRLLDVLLRTAVSRPAEGPGAVVGVTGPPAAVDAALDHAPARRLGVMP